jgi:hypothetical protein
MAEQHGTESVGVDIFYQVFLFSKDRSILTLFLQKVTIRRSLQVVVNWRIAFIKKFDYEQDIEPCAK